MKTDTQLARRGFIAIGTLALLQLAACGGAKIVEADLVGHYRLDSLTATGSLELRSDHTFRQCIVTPVGGSVSVEGSWLLRPTVSNFDGGVVSLTGAFAEDRGVWNKSPIPVGLPVTSSWKRIDLRISPDGNESYVKKK
jgi:hypothetical protein